MIPKNKGMMYEAKPMAIYNADEKRLVAIVASGFRASKLIFGRTKSIQCNSIAHSYANRKGKAHPKATGLPYSVALRWATAEQARTLGSAEYALFDEILNGRIIDIRRGGTPSNEYHEQVD